MLYIAPEVCEECDACDECDECEEWESCCAIILNAEPACFRISLGGSFRFAPLSTISFPLAAGLFGIAGCAAVAGVAPDTAKVAPTKTASFREMPDTNLLT